MGAEGRARSGNTRDRSRARKRSTRARGCPPAVEDTSGRRERLIFTEGRRKRPRQTGKNASRESAKRDSRERRRCQRFGSIGIAQSKRCCAPNPEGPPKRVRRRETPGPPVSWSRVQARWPRARRKPRRDAGSSRGAGTRSQAVGSRSRSYASRSFSAASRKADHRKDELARGELPHR